MEKKDVQENRKYCLDCNCFVENKDEDKHSNHAMIEEQEYQEILSNKLKERSEEEMAKLDKIEDVEDDMKLIEQTIKNGIDYHKKVIEQLEGLQKMISDNKEPLTKLKATIKDNAKVDPKKEVRTSVNFNDINDHN